MSLGPEVALRAPITGKGHDGKANRAVACRGRAGFKMAHSRLVELDLIAADCSRAIALTGVKAKR
jgi:hypothetical protein